MQTRNHFQTARRRDWGLVEVAFFFPRSLEVSAGKLCNKLGDAIRLRACIFYLDFQRFWAAQFCENTNGGQSNEERSICEITSSSMEPKWTCQDPPPPHPARTPTPNAEGVGGWLTAGRGGRWGSEAGTLQLISDWARPHSSQTYITGHAIHCFIAFPCSAFSIIQQMMICRSSHSWRNPTSQRERALTSVSSMTPLVQNRAANRFIITYLLQIQCM